MVSSEVRRWYVGVFPYQLWYRVSQEARVVRVIAVVSDSQDREQFVDRLG